MPLNQFAPPRKASSSHLQHERKLIEACEIMASLTLLRGRWKLPLIWNLSKEPGTLAGFRRIFPIASEKMLSQHLAELMRDGFVSRRADDSDKRVVSYTLTPLGESLMPTLESLRQWGVDQSAISRATGLLDSAE